MKIFAIGKKHEPWIEDGVKRYQGRLYKPWNVEWVLLPHSALTGLAARQEESERILHKLSPPDHVILLDENGSLFDSPSLSMQLKQAIDTSKNIVFVIGGAYGVNEEVKKRADIVWSLSPLVFPHQLVRLMLIEQIYRSEQIASGKPYHHQ